ncbi:MULTISPECIES: alpha/beta fold hydrolase [unclassified Streptomyces]|uniref:Alpha/beta hydrolase n=2 Tax=unclassified Streptomyces TaxID=2593676 RepID=A0A6G3R0J5_9ACTN|nr:MULTISPECIES: alpha/beta fold hydrolase [unclassified Streptomyces]NEA89273.1 alpha/beta hydrolase [Streptomyces sp. SID14436]NEC79502.1 alpha/beta hydrolase [Streptomyces sp. SID7958]
MPVTLTDHAVRHTSTVPASAGWEIDLFLREYDGHTGPPGGRRAVLMLHGRSVPVLAGFDLRHKSYSWADALAKAGYDVFLMDLQGSGRSPRPKMDDPCNVNPAVHESLLTPNPLSGRREPGYPYQLNNSHSDRDELHTVVEYIRRLRGVAKVSFVGWSAASFVMGPYAIAHPDTVESLFLLAPMFPPRGNAAPPPVLPAPGYPTFVLAKDDFARGWDAQVPASCPGQREAGMVDVVWDALMDNDPVGRGWGAVSAGRPAGLSRYRNAVWWGWNTPTASGNDVLGTRVPVLIAYGEHDTTANTPTPNPVAALNFSVPALHTAISGPHKIMVRMTCAGHQIVWEGQHKNVHNLSKQWLKHAKVDGRTEGRFVMAESGSLTPEPEPARSLVPDLD